MQRDRDFLIAIARRYYLDGKSQQDIGREYGMSRPTVSSILKQCRSEGIVDIRIQSGSPRTTDLGDRIKRSFGLDHAVVIPDDDHVSLLSRIGAEAASFAHTLLHEGIQVGIAWGMTLYQMVHQLKHVSIADSGVVQLMGGFGASNPQYDGIELAREFAKRINAAYYPLMCPVLVKNSMVKKMLIEEPWIRDALYRTESLDAAFVGISSNAPESSALVRAGFLSRQEAGELQEAGAVGHICGYSYDASGVLMDHPVNRRIIGINFDKFLTVPQRVGVACGPQKAEAVLAALRGRHLTALITDESVASFLAGSAD